MQRLLACAVLAVVLAGCQTQNPYAAFGPATVPPPGSQAAAPYYPPAAGAAASATTAASGSITASPARTSVSAEPGVKLTPAKTIVADAADREPIRIVENPAPAARTATAPQPRTATPGIQAAPAASPTRSAVPPTNGLPANPSGYAPAGTSPAYNRTRGYSSAAPPSEGGVAPAAYQATAPASAPGQWRAR